MQHASPQQSPAKGDVSEAGLWSGLQDQARRTAAAEPILGGFLHAAILSRASLGEALGALLAERLADPLFGAERLARLFADATAAEPGLEADALADLRAIGARDPAAACGLLTPFLYYKGYHALQAHRVAHWLWGQGRAPLAYFLQARVARTLSIDIHPAARFGHGVFIDHGTGVVVGETAVVGNDVSILQGVTLGGTGKADEDRHPKIGNGVLIGAGAIVLGNIKVGDCARIGAGSVVIKEVPPRVTVAGVPAKVIGEAGCAQPALVMDQMVLVHDLASPTG